MIEKTENLTGSLPSTINIHLTNACNLSCKHCFARFGDCEPSQIPVESLVEIITAVADAPQCTDGRPRKVNFVGGEPLLYPWIYRALNYSKMLHLTTSIVTNGFLLDVHALRYLTGILDILGISMDSVSSSTNKSIGRWRPDKSLGPDDYLRIAEATNARSIRLKVNTVVSRMNLSETLGPHVARMRPFRWKILQAKKVDGQNQATFESLSVTRSEFADFVSRNSKFCAPWTSIVPETTEDMTGSYAMIAPNGCFFDSNSGSHAYSRPILEVGIMAAFEEVAFLPEKFSARGGVYA